MAKAKSNGNGLAGLRAAVDKAGELQQRCHDAQHLYACARKDLEARLRLHVGVDVWAQGAVYKAALLRDKETVVDVLDLLEEITSARVRRKVLSVKITAARKELSPAQQKKLFVERYKDVSTLRIAALKGEAEGR